MTARRPRPGRRSGMLLGLGPRLFGREMRRRRRLVGRRLETCAGQPHDWSGGGGIAQRGKSLAAVSEYVLGPRGGHGKHGKGDLAMRDADGGDRPELCRGCEPFSVVGLEY